MFINKNMSRILFLGWIIVIIFMFNTACAQGPVPVPNNTVAVLAVDKNGKITALDTAGNKLKECKLKGPIDRCQSLDETERLGSPEFVMIFKTKKNPCYLPIFIGGYQIEVPVPCP